MNYTLTAQVSMNISSWGETVSITISDNGVISAISQCKGQLFDWGKNKKNISTLFKKVDELIEKVSNEDVENLDSSNDILGQIERLATLQEKGIISKDEFEEKKKDLLKRM